MGLLHEKAMDDAGRDNASIVAAGKWERQIK
jgi:hypothetical protein